MSEPNSTSNSASKRPLFAWFDRLLPPLLILASGLLVIVALGAAQRLGWISAGGAVTSSEGDQAQTYICPMDPQIRQNKPGRCPICGMALELADKSSANTSDKKLDELATRIEPAQRRLANIQTDEVRSQPIQTTINTVGSIAIDESRMATIAAYVDGRIERLFADYTGVEVATGDHLAVVYSPELFTAQVEYLDNRRRLRNSTNTLEAVRQAHQRFVINSRRKLQELGLQEKQIQQLEQSEKAESRQTVYAPIGGTVIEKLAVEGKYVQSGEPIYRIADLSTVWLKLELFPEDASRIRFGQVVEARVASLPNERFQGRVAFIDPTVNERKRTVGVRVEFLNEERKLRPGDYADAKIFVPIGQQGEVFDSELAGKWISPMHPQIIRDAPGTCPICGMDLVSTARYGYALEPVEQPKSKYVPRSALLMAGQYSVVYVETEPGRFEMRPVTIGPILRDRVIILDGLAQGEKVATAGNFLIDSQMQLSNPQKPSLVDPTKAIAKAKERKVPLEFADIRLTLIHDESGQDLEQLYETYFRIQRSLAADNQPLATSATLLHQLAARLAEASDVPQDAQTQLKIIAKHSEHLHHLELQKARLDAFRPISHAIVTLATLVRGSSGDGSFHHMFCPMVKGGAGDWLQDNEKLLNPYWGSEMLTCGSMVQTFQASTTLTDEPNTNHEGDEAHPKDHQGGSDVLKGGQP